MTEDKSDLQVQQVKRTKAGALFAGFVTVIFYFNYLLILEEAFWGLEQIVPEVPPGWFWVSNLLDFLFQAGLTFTMAFVVQYVFPKIKPMVVAGSVFILSQHWILISFFVVDDWDGIRSNGMFMLWLRPILLVCASFNGARLAQKTPGLDARDSVSYRFLGVSPGVWLLLFLGSNPTMAWLSQGTANTLRIGLSLDIPFFNVAAPLLTIGLLWFAVIRILRMGLEGVRTKEASFRWARVLSVYVLAPLLIVIIPLIRDRPWFYWGSL